MEALFVEEQQAAINQLRANLESQPVTKGLSDSKIYSFNKNKGWVRVAQEYQHTETLSAPLNKYRWLLITWTFKGNKKCMSYWEFSWANNCSKGKKGVYRKSHVIVVLTGNCRAVLTLGLSSRAAKDIFSFWKRDWSIKITQLLFFFSWQQYPVFFVTCLKHGLNYRG